MPSLDALFDSESLLVAAAACMLGGFYLAGFFKATAFEKAPDRSGVVEGSHLLAALGWFWAAPFVFSVGIRIGKLCYSRYVPLPTDFVEAQLLSYAAVFGGPLALWVWLGFQSPPNALTLGLRGRNNARSARVGLWGIPAGLVLVSGIAAVSLKLWAMLGQKAPGFGHQVFKQMQEHPHDVNGMVFHGILAVLLAPICEEALFRGFLQTGLSNWASGKKPASGALRWICLLLVGVAFGAVHWGAGPPPMLPALVALGILLGWTYEYTGCFWVPVTIHMGFNAVSFAAGVWQIRHP